MLRAFLVLCIATCCWQIAAAHAEACSAIDFMAMPLPQTGHPPEIEALLAAYPDLLLSADGTAISVEGSSWLPLGTRREIRAQQALVAPTPMDQFLQTYPLGTAPVAMQQRKAPFFDPGRFRNGRFFALLWFTSEAVARESLVRVDFAGLSEAAVMVTARRGVACQLRAAVARLEGRPSEVLTAAFHAPGGGFNWRRIGGTDRLSAHSYGIAVDLNAELGGYWRWSGAEEGQVGAYDTRIPLQVVDAFETYGFIWGGKWHHFDGMHFEYRPELILHARIAANMR
ncbi:M15 family metallopeptidase [Salipiger pacificus]|uniref:M15 family metallopeptidase n=2 Tax=Salipiger mangrovisoli TaxID=2865933 RepID=A0ABR9WYF2_9RHOB|nr:M15 family metallopeptidase [Salipiger mangrovisoli]